MITNLSTEENKYLSGDSFSNSYPFKVASKQKKILTRIENIVDLTKGSKVIHLGFCDHLPLVDKKIENKQWLHNELLNNTTKCIGIDIDKEAVDYFTKKYNIENIYTHDITSENLLSAITTDKYDFLILGEILEHIDNPVAFLSKIKLNYGKYFNEIIISVPNALSYHNLRNVFRGVEQLNTDHRYWFTPFTLSKVVTRSGFGVSKFYLTQYYKGNGPIKSIMYNRFPLLRHGITIVGK